MRACLSCLALLLAGCRIEPEPGQPFESPPPPAEADPLPGVEGAGSGGGGTRGGSSPNTGGSASLAGSAGDPPSQPNGVCDAEPVTFAELASGALRLGSSVRLRATATSQKFLVSQSQSGSCLWGVFVGAAPEAGVPRGVFVVSYGAEATAAGCPVSTDAIPDSLTAGDGVEVVGRFSTFAPSGCSAEPGPQLIADANCPLELVSVAEAVEPAGLSLEIADRLARGNDAELIRRYAGGLVRLEGVTGLPNETGDGIVGPYGVLRLAETALEVHADVEYADLSGSGPRDAAKTPSFPHPTRFSSITGLVYLDYCSWSLAPRRRCEDFDPPSAGCP